MNGLPHECSSEQPLRFKQASIKASEMDENNVSVFAWSLLGKRWTLQIIVQLLECPQSFLELGKHIHSISESVLSDRLKELERAEVLERQAPNGRPVRVTYHLTAKGRALEPVIKAIGAWSQHF
jgi:DNA-binding HxlR family transcriptional regulator